MSAFYHLRLNLTTAGLLGSARNSLGTQSAKDRIVAAKLTSLPIRQAGFGPETGKEVRMNGTPNDTISLAKMIRQSDDQVGADMDDEIALMSITNGKYFCPNPTGSRIWQLIDQPRRLRDPRTRVRSRAATVRSRSARPRCRTARPKPGRGG